MSRVVVAGGSVAGLAAALALAGPGRRVVVLDGSAPPPDGPVAAAAQQWRRPLVPQAEHSHSFTSLGVRVLRERAPHLLDALLAAGATLLDLVPSFPGRPVAPVAGDAELVGLACRRTTLELVLHRLVRAQPGIELRHGVRVRGLVLAPRPDRVAGVVLDGGGVLRADLVLDATGRRGEARRWLAALGAPVPADLVSPTDARVFTRFYRRHGPPSRLNRGNAAGLVGDHYAGVLHPGDGDTFSVAVGVLPRDRLLTGALRHPAAFDAVARLTPGVADWVRPGAATPLTGVRVMGTPPNLLRGLALTPYPGLLPVGDAACVTDPVYGRGLSLAFAQAFQLADLVAGADAAGTGPADLGRAAGRAAGRLLTPWFEQAVSDGADRAARWRAALAGGPPPPEPDRPTLRTVARAAGHDPAVWRSVTRMLMTLTPPERAYAGLAPRVAAAGPPPAGPGPSRAELADAVRGLGG